eukprot:4258768-Prymnesium_polylepis.1
MSRTTTCAASRRVATRALPRTRPPWRRGGMASSSRVAHCDGHPGPTTCSGQRRSESGRPTCFDV